MTADVAAFLAGTPNDGWLAKKTAEGASGRVDYASREAAAGDRPKLVVVFEVPGGGDTTPPTLLLVSPPEPRIVNVARPLIEASFSDDGSGVDPASVRLLLDGMDLTSQAAITTGGLDFTPVEALAEGAHAVTISARDLEGNLAESTWPLTVDTIAPELEILAPQDPLLAEMASVQIAVKFNDATSGVDLASFALILDGDDVTSACAVDPSSATCASPDLASGSHSLAASIRDRAGNLTTVERTFELTVDLEAPVIAIVSPSDGTLINTPTALVSGTVSDDGSIASVTVNGQPVALTDGAFSSAVALSEGFNDLVVVATDGTGKQSVETSGVTLDTLPPTLLVGAPSDGQLVNQPTVGVEGTATDSQGVALVEVNGAAVALTDGHFVATVQVSEGDNPIAVRAVDAAGNAQEASLSVIGFSLPEVEITDPPTLAYLAATTVEVSGTLTPPGSTVTVNGVTAEVAGGTFVARGRSAGRRREYPDRHGDGRWRPREHRQRQCRPRPHASARADLPAG